MVVRGSSFTSKYTILQPFTAAPIEPGQVLLTFDDGPVASENNTLQLLDILEEHHTHACFCVIGKLAEANPSIIQEISQRGHTLVNHTYSHKISINYNPAKLKEDIERCDQILKEITGEAPRYFRPVAGALSKALLLIKEDITKQLLPVTFFAFDTHIKANEKSLSQLLEDNIQTIEKDNGGILVLHEQRYGPGEESKTRTWLPDFVDALLSQLKKKQYVFTHP
ncbi:MAG: polysaccharide deacetylase family protein [Verrucomicrobiota bacterium]